MSLILPFKIISCVNSSCYTDILMQYFIKVIHVHGFKKLFPMLVKKEKKHEFMLFLIF